MPPVEPAAEALRHVPGAGEVRLQALAAGDVNRCFRVLRDGVEYSMRLAADEAAVGIDRGWECRVLELAGTAGVAPPIAYCDPASGVLILRWVDGRHWTGSQVGRPPALRRMADLLRRVHALPAPAPARRMSPRRWMQLYGEAGAAPALRAAAAAHAAALDALPGIEAALCHSDLHALNVIDRGDSLLLLDWEYAHVCDPYWDLAGWSGNNDLTARQRATLLDSYLGRGATPDERARLAVMGWLFDYVCWLWTRHHPGDGSRSRLLHSRLQATLK